MWHLNNTHYEILLWNELFGVHFQFVGVPLQKSAFFMPGIITFFFYPLSKSAHTFVLCPTHFPLSFLMPTPPAPPSLPLALFLFASALRGLREGRTTRATPFWRDTPSHRAEWYSPALHKFPLSGSCVEASTGRIISPFWALWMYV